ncbi:MAG: IS1380 family transposase, partial [Candidatus Dormibacteria bacterium]
VLDRHHIAFDDPHSVANAGLILPATLAAHLGIEQAANQVVNLGDRPGHFQPGAKVMTLLHALIAGGECIDDADVLRSGSTASVLGHRVLAPSTLGTFLRSFTFGHVRQLDRLSEIAMTRAWAAGAGPSDEPMTMDIDSTICGVHGHAKQGAAYGYTKVLGYHPLLSTRADTGETLHVRMRKGSANTGRGAARFVNELVGRVRRAEAKGQLTLRADCGFWSKQVTGACRRHRVRFSITVRQTALIRAAIGVIPEDTWVEIEYSPGAVAQVAETVLGEDRLIVRRVRNLDDQGTLFVDWRFHAFVTDRPGDILNLEADHRDHAVVELAIRDLKEGSGLRHCPSGRFHANGAWLVLTAVAHNLVRWVASLGLGLRTPLVIKTQRRRLITLPGRWTTSARRSRL